MELRHLTYFRTVAELGSIAKAATALHMTQPTLSRQIAQLERALGHQLLRRSPRGTSLTPAGQGLRAQLGTIFQQIDRIPEVLRAAAVSQRLVHCGLPPGLPHEWFRRFGNVLGERSPRVKLSLHEGNSEEQRAWLREGLIDVGLVHFELPELDSVLVLTRSFGCAVPAGSTLAGRSSFTLGDLDGLQVMAHSAQENPAEEVRLRAAAEAAGAHIDWQFRKFSEHSSLIAESSGADAVLIGQTSAERHFPSWRWVPMDSADEVNSVIRTWVVWRDPDVPGVRECIDAMLATSRSRA
ncbi:LysR family transcriptional regulator [Amycolatopsis sp. RM579]|uniref:LysR family transcriptional regulator n=1 Tax=Amycolatopsis pithecellobii TaxID=664692 RepID=A0A6N7Z2R4_9PSEU|nr:LysR family transcriptional regulator [Amycolatopsis pithecellobii]